MIIKNVNVIPISWDEIVRLIKNVSKSIEVDGKPDIIIAIQRGGLIPGVILSHILGVRELIPLSVKITIDDSIYSKKIEPILEHNNIIEKINGKSILVVDDIAGSGETYKRVIEYLATYMPVSIKSFICVVNRDNWDKLNDDVPQKTITYIGTEVRGWIEFPWERRYIDE